MAQVCEIVERLAGHPDRFIPGHDPLVTEIYPRASDKVDAWGLHKAPSRSFGTYPKRFQGKWAPVRDKKTRKKESGLNVALQASRLHRPRRHGGADLPQSREE